MQNMCVQVLQVTELQQEGETQPVSPLMFMLQNSVCCSQCHSKEVIMSGASIGVTCLLCVVAWLSVLARFHCSTSGTATGRQVATEQQRAYATNLADLTY
jgi:ribosomal protein S27E